MPKTNEQPPVMWVYNYAFNILSKVGSIIRSLESKKQPREYRASISYIVSSQLLEDKDIEDDNKYHRGMPLNYIASMMRDFYKKNFCLYKQHVLDAPRFMEISNRGDHMAPSLILSTAKLEKSLQKIVAKNYNSVAFDLREASVGKIIQSIKEHLFRLGKEWVFKEDNDAYLKALIGPLSQGILSEIQKVIFTNFDVCCQINGNLGQVRQLHRQTNINPTISYKFENGIICLEYGMDYMCCLEEGMPSEGETARLASYTDSDLHINIVTEVNLACLTHVPGEINQETSSLIEQRVNIKGNSALFAFKSLEAEIEFMSYVENERFKDGFVFVNGL